MTQSSPNLPVEEIIEDIYEPPKVAAELIYGLYDKPPAIEAFFVALQHVLASFVGIITPPLLICNALKLDPANTSYIISMSLFASGISTFIQCKKIGPIGSGLLSLQGTSFAFLAPVIGVGVGAVQAGRTPEQALALIFGVCFVGAFIEIILSRFLHLAQKIFTPVVTGTVVMIIGLSLIKTGLFSIAGGAVAKANNTYGSWQNLGLGLLVMAVIILMNMSKNRFMRMGAIAIGLGVGYIVSIFLGIVNFGVLSELPLFSMPIPFRFGFDFNFPAFAPFIILYVITAIETIGDLTATSAVSGEPVKGGTYIRRIKGGVLGDGVNSALAAVFNTFPNTTFSQNNGVIQMTGVGSRYVGFYVAAIFTILGLIPVVGGIFQALPQAVLGGATIIMFGMIAVAGMNIVSSVELGRRELIILATSLALGLGVVYNGDIFADKHPLFQNVFSSGISTGGLTAILLNLLLPRNLNDDKKVNTTSEE